MVCDRCIKVLKNEILVQQIRLNAIELGHVQLDIQDDNEVDKLKAIIERNGFELMNSVEDKLTEQVKILLVKIVNKIPVQLKDKLSAYLAKQMHQDYSKISKIFSLTEGVTVEKYYIKLKIEKVKELIQTQDINFTEISLLLDYNHINHLSKQFKVETGMSLSQYKIRQKNLRNPLDRIV